jgi:oxygen-independent coproporphyrinogen-3 oxidase
MRPPSANADITCFTGAAEYAGIGPRRPWAPRYRRRQHAVATSAQAWLMRVEASANGVITDDRLNSEERADEFC